jgi:hypothetical protein
MMAPPGRSEPAGDEHIRRDVLIAYHGPDQHDRTASVLFLDGWMPIDARGRHGIRQSHPKQVHLAIALS